MDAISFLAGAAVAVASQYAGSAVARWVARRKEKAAVVPPPPQYDPADVALNRRPADPPRNPSARWQWFAMPCGTRLELGDTGFWITLDARDAKAPYAGFTPEGRRITWGSDLAAMKRYLEGEAAERAEFTPVRGWKP